jgi:hypothetical protein
MNQRAGGREVSKPLMVQWKFRPRTPRTGVLDDAPS